ncbi:MAG: ribonuclease HII [Syntrophomonadaceae bacterium]|nr:ribonuclease HII [Syntrophomonadaceae bacterium]
MVPETEVERLRELSYYEECLFGRGFNTVAGIDEAGRGPLAGPVVAAAVILPRNLLIPGVNDSKKLSPSRRQKLAVTIKHQAMSWAIGIVYPPLLDQINILEASKLAMINAVKGLAVKPRHLLIDAVKLPELSIPQTSLIKGDSLSISIACASILAKVERDAIMEEFDAIFPGYGMAKHKGYPTKGHLEELFRLGPCPIHRTSFEPIKSWPGDVRHYANQS